MHQKSTSPLCRLLLAAAGTTCVLSAAAAQAAPTLEGWALMPAQTSAVGPTSGQFAITASSAPYLPIVSGQPVQGFSAVLDGQRPGTYHVMPDNGFGAQDNSADTLLRMYAVRPEWKRWNGYRIAGAGSVKPVSIRSGRGLDAFGESAFIGLRDPDRKRAGPAAFAARRCMLRRSRRRLSSRRSACLQAASRGPPQLSHRAPSRGSRRVSDREERRSADPQRGASCRVVTRPW